MEVTASMGPIRSPSGESARHEDAQKRLISATAAAQKRRVGGLAYESPAALRGWRSGEQAGTCSAVLGAAGESRERGRGWPPRAAKAKYRTILRRSERKAVSWLWGGAVLRGPGAPSCVGRPIEKAGARPTAMSLCPGEKGRRVLRSHLSSSSAKLNHAQQLPRRRGSALALRPQRLPSPLFPLLAHGSKLFNQDQRPPQKWRGPWVSVEPVSVEPPSKWPKTMRPCMLSRSS